MAEANIFELAELGSKADAEKNRQAGEFARLGVDPPAEANINVFQRAEAALAKEPKKESPKEDEPGLMRKLLGMVKESALPGLLGMGGGALGLASPIPGGALMGEAVGSGLGEQINQWTGITEPSKTNVGIAAAVGPAGRVIGPVLKGGGGLLMKMFGKRDIVADLAEGLLKKELLPKVASSALYNKAEQQAAGLITPSKETARAVTDIVEKEVAAMPTEVRGEILKAVGPLKDYFHPPGTPGSSQVTSVLDQYGKPVVKQIAAVPSKGAAKVPAEELMAGVRRLRFQASKAFKDENMDLYRSIDSVRMAILDDLEKSGVPAVRQASKAYRKELAVEELGMIARKARPFKEWKDALDESKLFAKSFDQGEKAQIERILKKIAWVSPTGGSGSIGRAIAAGAGYHFGDTTTAFAAFFAPEVMEKILGTPLGRNMAEKILGDSTWRSAGKYGVPQAARLAALQTFGRGLMGQGSEQTQ
jgi:hypothetical protein